MWRVDRGNRGVSEAAQPLAYADEISGMSPREMLVLMRSHQPFKVRQLRWYTVRSLRRLARLSRPDAGPLMDSMRGQEVAAVATPDLAPDTYGTRPVKVGKALDWTHLP